VFTKVEAIFKFTYIYYPQNGFFFFIFLDIYEHECAFIIPLTGVNLLNVARMRLKECQVILIYG